MSRNRGDERKRKKRRAAEQSKRRGDWVRHAGKSRVTNLRGREIAAEKQRIGPDVASAKFANLGEQTKALLVAERARELFDVKSEGAQLVIKRWPNGDTVRELAELVVNCWPRDWSPSSAVSAPRDDFSLLYWGERTPSAVLNPIVRSSLYAERILVVNPFTEFVTYHPQYSPLLIPSEWAAIYANRALFFVLVEPWIRSGVVEVVQNPSIYNAELHTEILEATTKRVELLKRDPKLASEFNRALYTESYVNRSLLVPEADRADFLEQVGVPAKERAEVLARVKVVLEQDPIRAQIPNKNTARGTQMMSSGSGMSLESARFISTAHSANIFTDSPPLGRMLEQETVELNHPFQQVANTFSATKLDFLNNVSPEFALGLRSDGKLKDFRQYLCGLAKGLQVRSPGGSVAGAARDFSERLEGEYARYKEEWKDIQRKLGHSALGGLVSGTATGTAAILGGTMGLAGVLGGALAVSVASMLGAVYDRRKVERQPLGVLLKLDQGKG